MGTVSGVTASRSSRRYRFADLLFDAGRHRLSRAGAEIALGKLSYELVRVLVEAAPNLVTHDELAERVWGPRRIVTAENLAKRVMILRQALGDRVDSPRYIEGVRGQGYRLIPQVEVIDFDSLAEQPRQTRTTWRVGYVVAALAFVALGLAGYERYESRGGDLPSITLLPCENHSAANENAAFLASGLHNELLTQLGKIGALEVVESVVAEPRRWREIGRELGVASILTCAVQRAGDAILVNVRLVDTETEGQLWGQSYEREYTVEGIFAIQREIATSIASILQVTLTPPEAERLAARPTGNLRAYELYLAANRSVMTAGDVKRAIAQLEEAVRLDAGFAEAWAAKAAHQAGYPAFAPPEQAAQLGVAARHDAKRAVALRPESSFVRGSNAYVLSALGDWIDAEYEHRVAFALGGRSPNLGDVLHKAAVGDFEAAHHDVKAILERAPASAEGWAYLVATHGLLGETAREEKAFAEGEELHGDDWFGGLHEFWFRLARTRKVDRSIYPQAYAWAVDSVGAADVERLAGTEKFESSAAKLNLALWAAFYDDHDLALRLMRDAFEHTRMNTWFIWMPLFQETRQRPGFISLLHELGLVDYWDEFGWPSICRRAHGGIRCD